MHTRASADGTSSLRAIVNQARRLGLGGVAVTDHNLLSLGSRFTEMQGVRLINGEEADTTEGEIVGLFLKEPIPPGLSASAAVGEIKGQGGVVYLPHPFKVGRRKSWSPQTLAGILPDVDVIEVHNGRLLDPEANRRAWRLAREAGKLMGAGSDAHTTWEVGRAYVEMEAFDSAAEFLAHLQGAKIYGRPPSRLFRVVMNRFVRKGLRHLALVLEQFAGVRRLWPGF